MLTDHIILHFLELPKFEKDRNFASLFEKWMAYFKYEGRREELMETIIKDDPVLEKAHNKYTQFTADDELMQLYEARIKYQLDYNSDIYNAKEEGREEGVKAGKIEDALKMLDEGFKLDVISRITGLTISEIERLRH